jgi:phosphoglycolate phosphatase-like HAD superfamily hydrolase
VRRSKSPLPVLALLGALLLSIHAAAQVATPGSVLPSWNEGQARSRVIAFVQAVTDEKGKDYVAPEDRIAAFDNDGTLWSEQPLYFQFLFMLDQMKRAAPRHPEWKSNAAFLALQSHDTEALEKMGQKPVLELLGVANSGMTVGEYDRTIRDWIARAHHPKFKRPYTDLVYQPMQELLQYLRANGFRTFIVSGGSVEFMRPWVQKAYGIPPEQVVGSQQEVKLDMRGEEPVLTRGPTFAFVDDGPGKPVGIYRHIGKRPIAAFGNSDGDLQMLQVAAAGKGRRLVLIVHHDDAAREFAYDRKSHVGRLDKALDAATAHDWVVVSMKADWKKIFRFERQE